MRPNDEHESHSDEQHSDEHENQAEAAESTTGETAPKSAEETRRDEEIREGLAEDNRLERALGHSEDA